MTKAFTDCLPTVTEMRSGLPILRFDTAAALDDWLSAATSKTIGIWLKLAKKGATTVSISRAEAIDAALCHGWIDGQQDRYDAESWLVRFTPRKRGSLWSEINRTRALELIEDGRVRAAGLAAIASARSEERWETAYPPASTAQVPPDLQAALDRSPKAAALFAALRGAKRYTILYSVITVKRPETRARRIAQFVAMLEKGEISHANCSATITTPTRRSTAPSDTPRR